MPDFEDDIAEDDTAPVRAAYLAPQPDGSVIVTLSRPQMIAGAKVPTLTMREPTVGDQVAAMRSSKSSASREIAILANLCEITPDDLSQLTLRDYGRLQAAFSDFLS
jgi:hypothetical protein